MGPSRLVPRYWLLTPTHCHLLTIILLTAASSILYSWSDGIPGFKDCTSWLSFWSAFRLMAWSSNNEQFFSKHWGMQIRTRTKRSLRPRVFCIVNATYKQPTWPHYQFLSPMRLIVTEWLRGRYSCAANASIMLLVIRSCCCATLSFRWGCDSDFQ